MPEFRDIVHVGDKVGVPSNLRAMSKERKPHFKDTKYRTSLILGYVKENEGKKMFMQDLAKAGQYSNPSGAHRLLHQMLKEGLIEKCLVGRGRPSFRIVNRYDVVGPRENGPVIIKHPAVKGNMEKFLKIVSEPEGSAATADIPKQQPSRDEEKHQRDMVYEARVNADLWDFMKQLRVDTTSQNGTYSVALRDFANYLANKLKEK